MRLDKFLKAARILKRRTVAHDLAEGGRAKVNGKSVKPAHTLKEGDIVTVQFGDNPLIIRVLSVDEKLAKTGRSAEMYKVIED